MALLAVIAMALIAAAVIPSARVSIKNFLLNSDRTVLAKVSGNLTSQGPQVTVLKIKTKESLSLEIYSNAPQSQTLMAKVPLSESQDGYFLLQGNATNLAIADIDKDGDSEIVAPTYDDQMIPRLNIFKYNSATKSFDRVNAPQ
ncbi:MAG: hypothetical protein ACXVCN_10730 [Bdellovibrio sp.]